jgi:hypothetical protein
MPLTGFAVDEGPHNMDGLLLHGWEGPERVEAFISRRVMDSWVDPREPYGGRRSLRRAQYNALGKFNLAAIERIVVSKYQRGAAFNRQHPFVDILLSDITESGEALDLGDCVRESSPPSFQRVSG